MLKKYICGPECDTFLDTFFNSMKDGFLLSELIRDIYGNSTSFRILEVNKAFEEIFEVNSENIINNSTTLVFPEMKQEWDTICNMVSLNCTSMLKDIYFKSIDKHLRVNLICLSRDKFIVLFHDITSLIKADEAHKKYFMLFENAKDIILYLRTDGSIIDANKTAVEQYGYTKEELLCMKIQQLRHPLAMKDFENQMNISASTGVVFETVNIKKDGTSFPVEVSSKTLEINGELIRFHIVRDITVRKKNEEKITYFANYDTLTGIYNRGYLLYQLRKTLEQANIDKSQFAVLLFDVDKFKFINDTYGHHVGDEVLKQVSIRLQSAVRESDIIGRLGGDEFLVVQRFIKDNTDPIILSKAILDCVSKPIDWEGLSIDVHISIGISMYPENSDTLKGLLRCADSAMYAAKQDGGNTYKFYLSPQ